MKELEKCLVCGRESVEPSHFYRAHKLKLEDYCLQYFSKRDLLDGTLLPFKSPDSYFSCDFLNKNNLRKYLRLLSKDDAVNYCKQLIIRRKEQKNLVYTPFQVELQSLPCFPPVHYLISLFDYYKFCDEIGLKNKVVSFTTFPPLKGINGPIIIDSRESQPLSFNCKLRIEKLNVGDYMHEDNPKLSFDRKSLADFISTLSQGLDRFTKELERAQEAGIYLVLIVENKLSDVLSFNHLPWMKRVRTKATPDFIMHNLRGLLQQFPNFQAVFCNGREHMKDVIIKGFLSGELFKQTDLQLAIQLGKL